MELDINGTLVESPTAPDIARALDVKAFPDDWYMTLDAGDGRMLDAVPRDGGGFTVTHDDGPSSRKAVADVAGVKSMFAGFLAGDRSWADAGHWQQPAKAAHFTFVKDTRPLAGRSGNDPPAWAMAVMIAIVGLVLLIFAIGRWDHGSLIHALIPMSSSTYFWVGLICLPMIALVIVAAASKGVEFRKASSWERTTGRVVRSEIEARHHRFAGEAETVKNAPAVEYEFTVGGRTIHGSRIGIGDDTGSANTEATLARYPLGAEVAVFYDPADPRNCVLEVKGPDVGRRASRSAGAAGLALLVLFGGAIWWLLTRAPDLIDARFPQAQSGVVVFAASFGLALLLFFIGARRYSKQAANWPSVRGTVVKSAVESFRQRVGGEWTTSYQPVVEFAYRVHGLEYRGNRIKVGMTAEGAQDAAEKTAAKYPAGGAVEVHYDPADPSVAALENPTGATWILFVLALGCFALAAWQLGIFR